MTGSLRNKTFFNGIAVKTHFETSIFKNVARHYYKTNIIFINIAQHPTIIQIYEISILVWFIENFYHSHIKNLKPKLWEDGNKILYTFLYSSFFWP